MPPRRRYPDEGRSVNLELFANRHRNKVEVILGSFDLPHGKWKKGTTCAVEMYATAPVELVVWLCTHEYGWHGGPTTMCRYVMARVTLSKKLSERTPSSRAKFRTEFILIEDGPSHVEYH
jgi:hypothetical protein